MTILYFALLLAGLACFIAVAFSQRLGRIDLLGLGLAFWILVPFIHACQRL